MKRTTDHYAGIETASKRCRVSQAEAQACPSVFQAQCPAIQHGNQYGNTAASDNSRVHNGDIIHNHHSTVEQRPGVYETLFRSLDFDRIDARLRNVATALPATCEWLQHHELWDAWNDVDKMQEHHGFLWIKGKPGSGKSTIMKETLTWAKKQWPTQTILSYFFNARAPQKLEKSSLGMYRSLLYQLLCTHLDVQTLFAHNFASKVREGKVENWAEVELQNFLFELVASSQLPPTIIFIDALDEGDDDDIRQMVRFMERLTQRAIKSTPPLRICLSSRHYPHISVQKSLSLVLEDQAGHGADIERYIRNELSGADSQPIHELQSEIHKRSSGVFLWVILVIQVLNKVYDRGKSVTAMFDKLNEMPADLHNVFTQIISRDLEDFDECITLLEWVLFSLEPLTSSQLYHAVQRTCAQRNVGEEIDLSPEAVSRYLLHCSRGLVEVTKAEPPVMQFIHETVRDYLLGKNVRKQRQTSLTVAPSLLPDFQADSCHMKIAECCLYYLHDLCEKAPLTHDLREKHPLARYAAQYWWQHIGRSESPCDQKVLGLSFDLLTSSRSKLLLWVQLYDFDDPGQYLPLAVNDLPPALYCAVRTDILELVLSIIAAGADVNARRGVKGTALHAASRSGREKVVQTLIENGADVNAATQYGVTALQGASRNGYEKVVQILIENGADVNAIEYGVTALRGASENGHEEVVRILIENGADVNAIEYGGTALQLASENGHEEVVRILVENGADVNAAGGHVGTALQRASRYGNEKVVHMLLNRGADVNPRGRIQQDSPLQLASEYGHDRVVQLLLSKGAKPDEIV